MSTSTVRRAGRRWQDEDGCGSPGTILSLLLVSMTGAWLQLRFKMDTARVLTHAQTRSAAFFTVWRGLACLAVVGTVSVLFSVWCEHTERVPGLDPGKTRYAMGWWSPGEVLAAWVPASTSAGAALGTTAAALLSPLTGPGTDATVMLGRLLPWQAAGATMTMVLLVLLQRRNGLWDGPLYPGHPGTPGYRARVRRLARRARIGPASAIGWASEFGSVGTPAEDELADWDALVGPDAPLWAAAGLDLGTAAWLAALPPWHPNRPRPEALAAAAARLVADRTATEELDGRCVAPGRCPSHGPLCDGLLDATRGSSVYQSYTASFLCGPDGKPSWTVTTSIPESDKRGPDRGPGMMTATFSRRAVSPYSADQSARNPVPPEASVKDTPVHTHPPHAALRRSHRDEEENAGLDHGLGIIVGVLAIVLMGVWVFLRGKTGHALAPTPPPLALTPHDTAVECALSWSVGGFFVLLLGVPFMGAVLGALLRALGLDKRLVAGLNDILVWAGISGAAGTVLGGLAHWFLGPDTSHLTGSRDILLSGLPWQTRAAALFAFAVLVFHWRGGGWDRHLYPDPDVDRDTRSCVRDLARQARVPLLTAVVWHTTVGYRNAFGDGHLPHIRSGNLTEWGAIVGTDAPLWAAAGYTLDDAAWLAALPPWDPNRPSDTVLRHTAAVRDELRAAPTALSPCVPSRVTANCGPGPALAVLLVAG